MKQAVQKFSPFVKYLFFITAVVLAVFGALSFMRAGTDPDMEMVYNVYAVLMFGDAIAMLICGLYINRRMKPIYWFAVAALSLNIVLTIFDQVGLIDVLFLLLNVITLTALIVLRRELIPQ
jgi:lysylphosphatidylglycerol synthetase-like protein (DUF2156 family)